MDGFSPTHTFWKSQIVCPPNTTRYWEIQQLPFTRRSSSSGDQLQWSLPVPPRGDYLGRVALFWETRGPNLPYLQQATVAIDEAAEDILDGQLLRYLEMPIIRGSSVLVTLPYAYLLTAGWLPLEAAGGGRVTLSWQVQPDGAELTRAQVWLEYLRVDRPLSLPPRVRNLRRVYTPLYPGPNTLVISEGRPVRRIWWYLTRTGRDLILPEMMTLEVGGQRVASGPPERWQALRKTYTRGHLSGVPYRDLGLWVWRHDLTGPEAVNQSHQLTLEVGGGGPVTAVVYLWEMLSEH